MTVDSSGWYSRTLDDEGHADTALVGGALGAFQEAIVIEPCWIGSALLVRTIVRGEDYQGVFVQTLLLEFVKDFAHLCIQTAHHGCKLGMLAIIAIIPRAEASTISAVLACKSGLVLVQKTVLWLPQFGMGQRVGKDSQEGLLARLAVYPLQGILVDEVAGILLSVFIILVSSNHALVLNVLHECIHHHVLVAILLGVITIQEVGIISMCLELADVSIVAVYATRIGQRGTAALLALGRIGIALLVELVDIGVLHVVVTACPLAKHARGVSSLLHHLGYNLVSAQIGFLTNEGIIGIIGKGILLERAVPVLTIASHMGVTRMLARHERCTRRSTHWTTGIGLGKAHTLLSHTVQIGGLYPLLTIATKVAIAHIITHNKDNVGACLLLLCSTCRTCHHGSHAQGQHHHLPNFCHMIYPILFFFARQKYSKLCILAIITQTKFTSTVHFSPLPLENHSQKAPRLAQKGAHPVWTRPRDIQNIM